MSEKTVWAIKVFVEATTEDANGAVDRIANALCPDEEHPDACTMP